LKPRIPRTGRPKKRGNPDELIPELAQVGVSTKKQVGAAHRKPNRVDLGLATPSTGLGLVKSPEWGQDRKNWKKPIPTSQRGVQT